MDFLTDLLYRHHIQERCVHKALRRAQLTWGKLRPAIAPTALDDVFHDSCYSFYLAQA